MDKIETQPLLNARKIAKQTKTIPISLVKRRSNSDPNLKILPAIANFNNNINNRVIIGANSPNFGMRMQQNDLNNKRISHKQLININGVQRNIISPNGFPYAVGTNKIQYVPGKIC